MKKLHLIILLIVGMVHSAYPCGTHSLHTQAEVDHLICMSITNSVTIEPNSSSIIDPITNLDSLISIVSIGTDLIIRNNPSLHDIRGLENLVFVGGDLIIENNSVLSSCCFLYKLFSEGTVQGNIVIRNNGGGDCNNQGQDIAQCLPIPTMEIWGLIILGLCIMIISRVKIQNIFFTPAFND